MIDQILKGWKEIAEYLRCTIRHARRLEKTSAMPVFREKSAPRCPQVWTTTALLIDWKIKVSGKNKKI
jgi:hypothetical protein